MSTPSPISTRFNVKSLLLARLVCATQANAGYVTVAFIVENVSCPNFNTSEIGKREAERGCKL